MRAQQILAASLLALALRACSAPAPAPAGPAPVIGPADDQTMTIVTAAQAYVASLSTAQATASLFAYNDAAQRARWSDLPSGAFERRGVRWADLNEVQRARLMDLLNAVLSERGVRLLSEQMAADEYLREHPEAGGAQPPQGAAQAADLFGAGLFYTAILGSPSVTAPWMLQFGGHHLAINATIVGPNVTLAPSLTGGQPVMFEKDGKPVHIVEREVRQAQALIDSLTPEQRAKAVLGDDPIDLILGPGHDKGTLKPEGLPAGEMTADQQAKLLALIEARVGLLNADDAAKTMARIRADIGKAWFAWSGPADRAAGAYFRVTAPTVILEFSPQDAQSGGAGGHLHSIYRDPTNDYGAAWAPLK